MIAYLAGALTGLLLFALVKTFVRRTTVMEYEQALLLRKGRRTGLLSTGVHWHRPGTLVRFDVRRSFTSIPGQEVITGDGISVKISLMVVSRIVDGERFFIEAKEPYAGLYLEAQSVLRELIAQRSLDELFTGRGSVADQLTERLVPWATQLGIAVDSVDLKDVMLPGELRRIYNRVAEARQLALAELERARGAAAVTRSLANTAKTYQDHPELWRMRLLDAMATSTGNTFVVGSESALDITAQ